MSKIKIDALRSYLNTEAEIVPSTYDENLFVVNPHTAYRGTAPIDVQASVAHLREVLVRLFGEEAQGWTSDFLRIQNMEYERLLPYIEKLTKPVKALEKALPEMECEARQGGFMHPTLKLKLNREMLADKDFTVPREVKQRVGGVVTLRTLNVKYYCRMKFTPDQVRRYTEHLSQLEMAQRTLASERVALDNFKCYRNLNKVIMASFDWPKQHDNDMAHAYQEIVNPLYFIGAIDKADSHASEYQQNLRNAFDGKPIEDKREAYEGNEGEYMVLTEEEADDKALEYIKDSVWAFNANWLAKYIPTLKEKNIKQMQEDMSEDCNEVFLALMDNITLDNFIRDSIRADGRGHFMNTYDGKEYRQDDYLIYCMNR